MAPYTEIVKKKVFGVPVLYLAGGAVIILGIVAWKMKPSTPNTEDTPPDTAGPDDTATTGDYSDLATQGTVTVVQQTPAQTTPDDTVKTNSDWVREGSEWLTKNNLASGSAAYTALSKYVNGGDRSYDEQQLVDKVIAEKGQPPDDIAEGASVGGKPAQKQFTNFPGVHTVTGNSDTSLSEIATIYYGWGEAEQLGLANPNIANSPRLAIGTRVTVPAYHDPKYWNVTADMTWAKAAGLNGISELQLKNLNTGDGLTAGWRNQPTLKKGQKIRVA